MKMTDHPITAERVRALAAIARNPARPPEIRLRAAGDILDMAALITWLPWPGRWCPRYKRCEPNWTE